MNHCCRSCGLGLSPFRYRVGPKDEPLCEACFQGYLYLPGRFALELAEGSIAMARALLGHGGLRIIGRSLAAGGG
jgi:hypothetical protein